MAQKRYYEYGSDDDTFTLTNHMVSLVPAGRYHGFDFMATADLNLRLEHGLTGFNRPTQQGTLAGPLGIIKTAQGILIEEDEPVVVQGVAAGDAANPRIDLVICEHTYKAIQGGEQAYYKIIRGTPAVEPQPPDLQNVVTQVKVGELYIPAGATALDSDGVTFSAAPFPMYAGQEYLRSEIKRITIDTLQKINKSGSQNLDNNFDIYTPNSIDTNYPLYPGYRLRANANYVQARRFVTFEQQYSDEIPANDSKYVTRQFPDYYGTFLVTVFAHGRDTQLNRTFLVHLTNNRSMGYIQALSPGADAGQGSVEVLWPYGRSNNNSDSRANYQLNIWWHSGAHAITDYGYCAVNISQGI